MIIYQLDYVIEKIKEDEPSIEQRRLKNLVGADFTKEEAKYVWERVIDHKWYVGERLKRDVGLRVAAIDYVENFYDDSTARKNDRRTGIFNRTLRSISNLTNSYLVSKSKTLPSL